MSPCRIDLRDADLLKYNKTTLPAFYGVLRMLCERAVVMRSTEKKLSGQERIFDFAGALCAHQNLLWAVRHVAVHHAVSEYSRVRYSSPGEREDCRRRRRSSQLWICVVARRARRRVRNSPRSNT
jgi:hypothetical protein